ncbi:DUF2804 domain-containing protein [Actinotalea subterranea]|uniref:DUF2804 domain-containing protein n=1 Tax=Actinotalea subterranea TaxID=2607497 RepID=UPI0011EE73B4|nr:DUF2804 domain-containing protein [Actinotalea subterranea]
MATELEITATVELCRADGRLDPAAVGWTRRPLHRTGLRGWGRSKRWEYWAVMTPRHVIALTVADLDYAAQHQVWVLDRATSGDVDTVAVVPLGRGVQLPASLGDGPAVARARGLDIRIEDVAGGTRLRARTPRVEVDVVAASPEGHESLGVVVPWSDRRFQYTVKDVARPASGSLTVDGVRHTLPDGASWAVLDHGRGRWPYRMRWNWGAGSGVVDGHVVGVQVGGAWTDGTGSTENALLVDGRLHKNSDDLVWEYDRTDWLAPWHVHDADRARVDLTFTPFHERAARTDLLIVAGETHQCFGTWSGAMTDDAGRRIRVDGVEGWAEEAHNRW